MIEIAPVCLGSRNINFELLSRWHRAAADNAAGARTAIDGTVRDRAKP